MHNHIALKIKQQYIFVCLLDCTTRLPHFQMTSQFYPNLSNYSYNRMFENVDGSIQLNVSIFQVSHVFPGKITLE